MQRAVSALGGTSLARVVSDATAASRTRAAFPGQMTLAPLKKKRVPPRMRDLARHASREF